MKKKSILGASVLAGAVLATCLVPSAAFGHGYVGNEDRNPETTELTARVAIEENTDNPYAAPWNTPQGMEAPKGFPAAGPADGQLASAGQPGAGVLDEQSENRWVKNEIEQGPISVEWTFTAAHKTSQWRYYMTLPGWDPNAPLDRGDLELIETVAHDGTGADNNPIHTLDIPEDRSGYHVIYAVWDVADTPNAFYNVIDVNVDGDAQPEEPDTESPSFVDSIRTSNVTSTSATVSWDASTDNTGVTSYEIYTGRGDKPAAVVNGSTTSVTLEGLTASTDYALTVQAKDAAGNVSGSAITPLRTTDPSGNDTIAPTAPKNLHVMDETTTSIDLMWGASSDNNGVAEYKVWDLRAGEWVARTTDTEVTVDGLTANTKYGYVIYAFDAAGNMSSSSNILVTSTASEDVDPELPVWDAFAAYTKGDKVTHNGDTYQAVQSYQGVGDPSWIDALALWVKI